jgi:hypothetical protein
MRGLWPHQRDAVLRAIFTNELLKPRDAGWKDLLLNVVTGGGKTTIIAAIMAYLRVCQYWEVQYMNELDRAPMVLRWTRHHNQQPKREVEPAGCLGMAAVLAVVVGLLIWFGMRLVSRVI